MCFCQANDFAAVLQAHGVAGADAAEGSGLPPAGTGAGAAGATGAGGAGGAAGGAGTGAGAEGSGLAAAGTGAGAEGSGLAAAGTGAERTPVNGAPTNSDKALRLSAGLGPPSAAGSAVAGFARTAALMNERSAALACALSTAVSGVGATIVDVDPPDANVACNCLSIESKDDIVPPRRGT